MIGDADSIASWREDRRLRGNGSEWRWPVIFGVPLTVFCLVCAIGITMGGGFFAATIAWSLAVTCGLAVIRLWTVRDRWEEEAARLKEFKR